jgi:hypothetical protein
MHEQWAWIIIHVHYSCSSGIQPKMSGPGPASKKKISKILF